ncbi:MAG: glutathione synthase, partial [Alphaproteobacteria bacterium]
MTLKIGIQMDDWSSVNVDADSTFALMLEAQNRGYELFHYLPSALSYEQGTV